MVVYNPQNIVSLRDDEINNFSANLFMIPIVLIVEMKEIEINPSVIQAKYWITWWKLVILKENPKQRGSYGNLLVSEFEIWKSLVWLYHRTDLNEECIYNIVGTMVGNQLVMERVVTWVSLHTNIHPTMTNMEIWLYGPNVLFVYLFVLFILSGKFGRNIFHWCKYDINLKIFVYNVIYFKNVFKYNSSSIKKSPESGYTSDPTTDGLVNTSTSDTNIGSNESELSKLSDLNEQIVIKATIHVKQIITQRKLANFKIARGKEYQLWCFVNYIINGIGTCNNCWLLPEPQFTSFGEWTTWRCILFFTAIIIHVWYIQFSHWPSTCICLWRVGGF